MKRTLLTLALIVITAGLLGTRVMGQPASGTSSLALVGGTIYTTPTDPPIRDGAVLIENGRITAVGRRASVRVPRATTVLDTAGSTITVPTSVATSPELARDHDVPAFAVR